MICALSVRGTYASVVRRGGFRCHSLNNLTVSPQASKKRWYLTVRGMRTIIATNDALLCLSLELDITAQHMPYKIAYKMF
eukprot:m.647137 g.647137  ORF g.647137 m.647137 type:complete len:80 (-) comp22653_c1_seq5:46-285(-)